MTKTLLPLALLAAACASGASRSPAVRNTTLSDFQQSAPKDAPEVPGIYDMKLCVVTLDPVSKMATFMPPNAENPNAPVAFAFNDVSGFAIGDLVTIAPGARAAKNGQPQVQVLEKASGQCSRYSGAGAHAHH